MYSSALIQSMTKACKQGEEWEKEVERCVEEETLNGQAGAMVEQIKELDRIVRQEGGVFRLPVKVRGILGLVVKTKIAYNPHR
jgi:hypothetical protein